jgi:transposase
MSVDVLVLCAVLECLGGMIGLPAGTRIWIAASVTDLRKGFTGAERDGTDHTQENPFSGHVFVFRGRAAI